MNSDFDEYVRDLCRRATAVESEDELQDVLGRLRAALSEHMTGLRGMVASHMIGEASHPRWNDAAESDAPLNRPRQPYFRRERQAAEGFVTWLRLSTSKAPGKSGNPQ